MELLIYIGKVSLYWTLFYACYWLFLRQHTFFTWNRFYLLGSLLISLSLPFVIYPESAPQMPALYEVNAAAFTITENQSEDHNLFTFANFLWLTYLSGALVMSFILYKNTKQLLSFLKQGEKIDLEDCTVVLINSNHVGSFSFLNWIVINRNDYEHHFDAILRHEMVHMQQHHTFDILLVEILKIVFWFNPVLIIYKKSLQEIHEFLADAEAPNRESYANFLVAYALNAPIASLTNHFFKPSQIKNRIQMIYKNRTSKWMLGTYMLAFATISTIAMLVAGCEQRENNEIAEVSKTVIQKESEKKPLSAESKKVYTVVEKQPEFPGGIKAMYEFLGENIKYPEAALKGNIEGKVFLSFVVSETGEMSDIAILKGIGYGCDAEAVRVLSKFPKWQPAMQDGTPVNVRYNLPINFQLKDKADNKTSRIGKQLENQDRAQTPFLVTGSVIDASNNDSKPSVRITGGNPLYIIDGKEEEDPEILKKMDPNTIASIHVLKDKKAVEAYGAKGSNGVVSITTKGN